MTENQLSSFELSKKLFEAGCNFDSEYVWDKIEGRKECPNNNHIFNLNKKDGRLIIPLINKTNETYIKYPAYNLLWDVCVKYAKEFWGEELVCENCSWTEKYCQCPDDMYYEYIDSYQFHTRIISELLHQNKKQDAEDYIWQHCLFNKEVK